MDITTNRLNELEDIIHEGLEQFIRVGEALKEVKDDKLYLSKYPTFEEYCRTTFNFGESRAYQIIRGANISGMLESEIKPERAYHVNQLGIVKDPELRNKAWNEVVNSEQNVTGNLVASYAQKYSVIETDPEIGKFISSNDITSGHAFELKKVLSGLPDYYRELVLIHGVTIQPLALLKLREMEVEFEDEFRAFISTGYLHGRYDIHFSQLTQRDVESYMGRLFYERTQQRIIEVSAIQKETKSAVKILSGLEIAEKMVELKDEQVIIYAFPEKQYTPEELASFITKNGYGVMYMGLYTKNEPDINFGDSTIKPSRINGVKPSYMIDSFKATI